MRGHIPWCEDAAAVLVHWVESKGSPYSVPCGDCTWDEEQGDDLQHSLGPDGKPCSTCGGTGWRDCTSLSDSPWVIDDFTAVCANLNLFWRGKELCTKGVE